MDIVSMRLALILSVSAFCLACSAHAEETPTEIDYLLRTVGSSNCAFIRNGKHYSATDAEKHLRMKYQRGKRYAPTTEDFIEHLASKSSMSKKLYHIDCPGEEAMPSGEWFALRLAAYREGQLGQDKVDRTNAPD
jgi:hypothetical protein